MSVNQRSSRRSAWGAVGFAVEQPQLLGGDPGSADLLVVVAGLESGDHPHPGSFGVVFVAASEQSADPEQRVVAVAAVTERVVLHSPANLVERV